MPFMIHLLILVRVGLSFSPVCWMLHRDDIGVINGPALNDVRILIAHRAFSIGMLKSDVKVCSMWFRPMRSARF